MAVITYRKFAEDLWPVEEFSTHPVGLVNGEQVTMLLAERGVLLSNGMWVREVRRRDPQTGHQTSIIATDFVRDLLQIAAAMFARWCQENFFNYMAQHFGLDRLVEYGTEPISETTRVVNPARRRKDQQLRQERSQLRKVQGQFGGLTAPPQATPQEVAAFEQRKGQLLEQMQQRQAKVQQLKAERKEIPSHLMLKELPKEDQFTQLRTAKKHFVDTIKLAAYRAETALVHIAREKLSREEDARALIRQLFNSTVDLCPDIQNKTLTVRLHYLTTAAHNDVLDHLCDELTATEAEYPGTNLKLIFEPIGSSQIPKGQES